MRNAQPEHRQQTLFFQILDYLDRVQETHQIEVRLTFNSPNGAKMKDPRHAHLMKLAGMRAGVPDILCLFVSPPYHGLAIEMKSGKNKPTDVQKEWLLNLKNQGYCVAVCYSAAAAFYVWAEYVHLEPDLVQLIENRFQISKELI